MKKLLLLSLCMLLSGWMMGQKTVSGTVTADGESLIGATVQIKGASTGTITDFDGKYSLEVVGDDVMLVFSYIGYADQEVALGDQTTIDVVMEQGELLDEIVVVGSRAAGRTKLTTAVPVDVIDVNELMSDAPQTNLNQILNYVAPSFTSNTQTISDGTDHIDPASLRGLGPDQVLVLINGKRRHTSSLVNVNGTFGRGNVGTDLNAIPAAAIERIEVLRDGAAAQYGSDAIAGVINIVLKKDVNKLTASASTGAYASSKSDFGTGGIDGEQYDLSLNYGLPLGDKGGFINFTGTFESRAWTSRMTRFGGDIFKVYNGVERLALAEGLDITNLSDDDAKRLAQDLPYLTDVQKNIITNADAATLHANDASINPLYIDLKDLVEANDEAQIQELTARGADITDFNMRVGQSEIRGGKFFANMEIPLGDNSMLYAFGGIAARDGLGAGFYRLPGQDRTYTPAYNNGFLPEIHTDILDKSAGMGIKGNLNGWNTDFSNVWGSNSFDFHIRNTSNASQQNKTPFEFDAGGFQFNQNTTNFDLSRHWDDILYGLNVAFGSEFRVENYQINAGEEGSYASYDQNEEVVTTSTPSDLIVKDWFGRTRPGGAQVFPGFQPKNEVNEYRNSFAGYVDIEADLTEAFLLGAAVRFESYSDFGETFTAKGVARYKVNENASVRAAASTGFRAPSLHQIYFNSTSTVFVDGIPNDVATFSNTHRVAKLFKIPELKEETSTSFSAGFTARIPNANISITVDAYQVNIDDRVVLTGRFSGINGAGDADADGVLNEFDMDDADAGTAVDWEVYDILQENNANRANFFTNAINTKSRGIDIVVSHKMNFSGNMSLRNDLSTTFSKTELDGDINTSTELTGLESTYFGEESRIYLEEAVPRQKINLSHTFKVGKFSAFLRNVYFGEVTNATNTVANQQVYDGKIVTDVTVGYQLTESLKLTIGSNNVLDVYPDKNIADNTSDGRFIYPRRSQQFGFQGRYIFGRLRLTF